ncbi:MAG: carbohydrate kinase family protein [Gammaproteobacteria bacterium]|nr:carbohydrate kinase family protein [Gammaproteobacteria bacterium]
MAALICGSLAYDTVMVYPGRFRDQILADRIHMLNVSFTVPKLSRHFGGCAGNIAYNLKLLGGSGYALGTVGHDFGPYRDWFARNGLSTRCLLELADEYTAQAYITTDLDDNQITAFHPGAMTRSHEQGIPADSGVTIGILSPDGRDGMLRHAAEFSRDGIPFLFDPGQALPLFGGQELEGFIDQATWVAVNDYEAGLLQERTGLTAEALAGRVAAYIVTRGGEGSRIHTAGRVLEIPVVRARQVIDPTGCGDAYRAGLLHGLMRGCDWETTGRIAALIGALKIAVAGTQRHGFTPEEFGELFHAHFGYRLD